MLTRTELAIRDFYDIDSAVMKMNLNLTWIGRSTLLLSLDIGFKS